eukprot:TRINITY_DN32673_c0_g1_i1.p1 TRINITY_DN32673_c0_g1~~TRINITY_DN32673_c0_g1_i1.p1  ORF type:complete len:248 (+),score=135.04 TRINITY_DN32673_c0_g1_i1:64-807(+)
MPGAKRKAPSKGAATKKVKTNEGAVKKAPAAAKKAPQKKQPEPEPEVESEEEEMEEMEEMPEGMELGQSPWDMVMMQIGEALEGGEFTDEELMEAALKGEFPAALREGEEPGAQEMMHMLVFCHFVSVIAQGLGVYMQEVGCSHFIVTYTIAVLKAHKATKHADLLEKTLKIVTEIEDEDVEAFLDIEDIEAAAHKDNAVLKKLNTHSVEMDKLSTADKDGKMAENLMETMSAMVQSSMMEQGSDEE